MTRNVLIALALLTISVMAGAKAQSLSFIDVDSSSPLYKGIEYLWENQIIKGYEDGTIKPNNLLNRAEMAKMIMAAQGVLPNSNAEQCFTDTPSNLWFTPYVCEGKLHGFWKGYSDGSFKPALNINRVEAIQMVCNAKQWEFEIPTKKPFSDTPLGMWYIPCTTYAKELGYLRNIAGRILLFPDKPITRGEFSSLLYLAEGGEEGQATLETTPLPLEVRFPSETDGTDELDGTAEADGTSEVDGANEENNIVGQSEFAELQQIMLNLTNEERAHEGFSQLAWSDELSVPARLHSEDMAVNDFFSHINLNGESPDDRRKNAGITTLVGENLALAPTIQTAHEALMDSPPHRENILKPEWERMGIGIAQNAEGYLLITQLFSKNAPSQNSLDTVKQDALQLINSERTTAGYTALSENTTLSLTAHEWNQRMIQNEFFALNDPDNTKLSDMIFSAINVTNMQMGILQSNDEDSVTNEILKNNAHMNANHRKIGIALDMAANGVIYGTVIVTD